MAEIIEKIAKSTAWDKYSNEDLKFPADSVLDAWETGKSDGKKEQVEVLKQVLVDNVNAIAEDVVELVGRLNQRQLPVTLALLKLVGINDFTILVGINEDDFLSDKMNDAYTICNEIELSRRHKFTLRFTFVGDDGNLDLDEIKADSYLLIHKLFNKNDQSS